MKSCLNGVLNVISYVIVLGRHIHVLVDGGKLDIGHTNLLALIDKGCALKEHICRSKCRATLAMILLASVAAYYTRVVMVLKIE